MGKVEHKIRKDGALALAEEAKPNDMISQKKKSVFMNVSHNVFINFFLLVRRAYCEKFDPSWGEICPDLF